MSRLSANFRLKEAPFKTPMYFNKTGTLNDSRQRSSQNE